MPILVSALLLGLLAALPAAAAPRVFWASDPVLPDETLMLLGDGLAGGTLELARQADAEPGQPATAGPKLGAWETIPPLQVGSQCLKAVVPASWQPGVYAARVRVGAEVSNAQPVNAPEAWWFQADQGREATPGGWLRVFGRCLAITSPRLVLVGAQTLTLAPRSTRGYQLAAELPATAPVGAYTIWVHPGAGGPAAWRSAGELRVIAPPAWKQDVFNVRDFGPQPAKALPAALKKAADNGGGVVYLPRGRYGLDGPLVIPKHTVLRGEGMALVSLYWPDYAEPATAKTPAPPAALIQGEAFGLEDLTLYCQHHRDVIQAVSGPAPDGVRVRRVRIRANSYFMIEDASKEFRGRRGPASPWQAGAAFRVRGSNFSFTDSDVYATNRALHVHPGCEDGVIARNRLRYGGRGYGFEHVNRLVFEGNDLAGNNLTSIGNDVSTFWSNNCECLWYADNHLHDMYGADREMLTLDAAGGAYFGPPAAVDGVKLTLAADPTFKDYAPRPRTDWRGSAVVVLAGPGAGQYRRVVSHEGREWSVDRPWDVPPDAGSQLSIVPFRGRLLIVGNTFEDGGAVQLYGMPLDCVVADNTGARMDGFFAWGLNPHGWGWQPAWCCQFLDNHVAEGNGYGHRAAQLAAFSSDASDVYRGPLCRAMILRRNRLDNNARVRLGGMLEDAVVEHNAVAHNEVGLDLAPTTRGVVVRQNRFDDVATPLTGGGLPQAVVVP